MVYHYDPPCVMRGGSFAEGSSVCAGVGTVAIGAVAAFLFTWGFETTQHIIAFIATAFDGIS